jgi:hypothetical protein
VISRRYFTKWLFGLPLLSFFPFRVSELRAQPSRPGVGAAGKTIGEFFSGEELHYEISFMFLKKVAVAKMLFKPAEQKGRYIAVLRGETLGVIGWLAKYRTDTYRAVMEEIDGGKRLRSISFEENVKIGKKTRTYEHEFDYQKRKWTKRSSRRGVRSRTMETGIPEGKTYDDFLCASYNFRYGVYGPIERGKTYVIPTFPRKGSSTYEIRIASKEEEDRQRVADKVGETAALLLQLKLDPEITDSKTGLIEGWLSRDIYPVEGIIKDVILFGDVHGKLVKRTTR